MATCTETPYIASTLAESTRQGLISEARQGLVMRPRSLSPWMFYDAYGSQLFDRITSLPQYYPARTERGILVEHANAMITAVVGGNSQPLRIVELGAGIAVKTGLLLEAALRTRAEVLYMPVDVSVDALNLTRQIVESRFPEVLTDSVVLNYVTCPLQLEPFDGVTLVLYLGSSIGNFSPDEARAILRNLSHQMHPRDALMLGTDLVKDIDTLLPAYDDDEGITAAFNLNILRRLNRELGADFDLDSFRHRALWNKEESRIEMHLESLFEQDVFIAEAQLNLSFVEGETIHTENSYKFTDESTDALLEDSGLRSETIWKDERDWFG
jgi:L-histidine Nalpha-methyltransferase